MPISQLTGGEAVVDSLIAQGVNTLFALPGVQNDFLFNALYDRRGEIRVIHTRHEQGAAFMALGYGLMRGDVGVYSVVPGPGFLNSTAALATAYGLNARVLALIGQLPSAQIGKADPAGRADRPDRAVRRSGRRALVAARPPHTRQIVF